MSSALEIRPAAQVTQNQKPFCLGSLLRAVLNQFTTQNLPEYYSLFENWIQFRCNLASGHNDFGCTDAEEEFYESHAEAFWAGRVIVETFCDRVIPSVERDPCFWNVYKICQEITARLYQQLCSLLDDLNPDFITSLSGERYESTDAKGLTVAIVPSETVLPPEMRFAQNNQLELCYSNVHAIRKQLNLAQAGALAICKNASGTYHTLGLLSKDQKNTYLHFVINGHMEWKFCVPTKSAKSNCRLRYHQGLLKLPLVDLKIELTTILQDAFGSDHAAVLSKIIHAIDDETHGAVMIVAPEAVIQKECVRLVQKCTRGTQLQALIDISAKQDMLPRFASIDGAVLVDEAGKCHAFGVILDGESDVSAGNVGRGARYNCTQAYVQSCRKRYSKEHIYGIVKSEDGMLDVIR